MEKKDFLRFSDFSRKEIQALLRRSLDLKKRWKRGIPDPSLRGKTLGLIFEKPSTRTRVSFEVAMVQLGGHPIYMDPGTTQIKRGETVADSARVLSRFMDAVVLRTFAQETVEEWARWASVPVINGLTDLLHPCQIFCDLLTIVEKKGKYEGLKVAYVGDGNNMANSWINAAAKLPFHLDLACPDGYDPDAAILKRGIAEAPAGVVLHRDPAEAVRDADVVYTDVWVSMGQEAEREEKMKRFQGYQVNRALIDRAKKDVLVMHCLPAHRGEEITAEVIDGPRSVIIDEAENRLHVQKAVMEILMR